MYYLLYWMLACCARVLLYLLLALLVQKYKYCRNMLACCARVLLYLLLASLVQKYKYCHMYARLLRSRAPLPPDLAESIKQRNLGAQLTRFTGTKVQIRTQKPEALHMLLAESIKQRAQLTRFTGTKVQILTQKRYAPS
jgi:hypothetical protein